MDSTDIAGIILGLIQVSVMGLAVACMIKYLVL